jgi:hypothetical protein
MKYPSLHLAPTLPAKPSTVNSCNFNYKRDRNSVKSGFTSFSLTFHLTKMSSHWRLWCSLSLPIHIHAPTSLVSVGLLFLSIILKMVTARYTVKLAQLTTNMWPNPECQSCTYACNNFRHTTVNAYNMLTTTKQMAYKWFCNRNCRFRMGRGVDLSYMNSNTPHYSTNYNRSSSYSDLLLKISQYLYAFLTHQINGNK